MAKYEWCEECSRSLLPCEVAHCVVEDEMGIWEGDLCLVCVRAMWWDYDVISLEVLRPLPNGWDPRELPELDGRRWVA